MTHADSLTHCISSRGAASRSLSFVAAVSIALVSIAGTATEAALAAEKLRDTAAPSTTTPVPRTDQFWVQRQTALNARVKENPGTELVFIGDSITHLWEGPGRQVWEKYYARRHAVNLGIGGDQTQHVLWRLDHGNLEGIHPKLAVLMIGTNNCHANTSEQIADGVRAIVEKLRSKLPDCKVLILAIFPRGVDANDRLRKVNQGANERIAKLADEQHVFYLDIGQKFLESDGKLPRDVMRDRLHPSAKGYAIWAEAIEPTVARLLGESS